MNLSIDAGGTYYRARILENDTLMETLFVKSVKIGLLEWIEEILKKHHGIKNICIAYAGQVKNGVILSAPNIKIDNHDIKNYFETKYDLKLFIENDLDCAVMAEAAHFQSKEICALYVGTGLGLGVISAGRLIRGHAGMATEIGHIPYKETPFLCGCGKSNCLELFASGSGLLKHKEHNLVESALNLEELKKSKDVKAKNIYDDFITALLYAAGTVITLFNPEILVLGGGIVRANEDILQIITSRIKDFAMPIALEDVKIVTTQMQDASLQGALLLKDVR
ncbi:ROK family protein [Sulfurimonas sp. HSL-1716]|uniref:ROK family protein n=1 Tax=Hydrocurvibacter sulfurireducens TaxID=3131937 RepID=UPI0031F7BE27